MHSLALRPGVHAVVLTGPGAPSRRVVRTIVQSDKLFVAALGGAAGVGLAFALACDVIVAAESARLVLAFGPLGLVPEVGTSWLLTRRLGYHATMALYLSGRHLDDAEALRLGPVSEVTAPGEEVDRALAVCERLRALPAHALAMTKPLLRAVGDIGWHQALAMEEFAEPICFTTEAHRAGVRSVARRAPAFRAVIKKTSRAIKRTFRAPRKVLTETLAGPRRHPRGGSSLRRVATTLA